MEEEQKKEERHSFASGVFTGILLMFAITLVLNVVPWKKLIIKGDGTKESKLELDLSGISQKMEEIERVINKYYMGEIDTKQVEDSIYRGMLWGLEDVYSEYYSSEHMKSMMESLSGEYSGIGATLAQDPYTKEISVVFCFEGSPADAAGLLPEDVILKMNGEDLEEKDLAEVVSWIKTESEDRIQLHIRRGEKELDLTVKKGKIEIPTVNGKLLENEIGYLQIVEFDDVTTQQFTSTMERLEKEGMKKLIVDLRNNPGGSLEVVCDILDQILPEGRIVYTEDKYKKCVEYFSDEEHQLTIPLVVLINENSASASEIFAGAVKDYELGTLVGTTTYGKGIVQRMFSYSDGSGMKLTIAKYYTPKGNDIHKKGIEPDIVVENPKDAAEENDLQLKKAVSLLEDYAA